MRVMPPKGAKGGPAFLTTMTTPYFQKSRRIYVSGQLHPTVAVALRQIEQSPTNHPDGTQSANPPVQVYDTSGPWGDPAVTNLDIREGLPALRGSWISSRGDVSEYDGRTAGPQDDGYLSQVHASKAKNGSGTFPGLRRRPLRASAGHPVTQLWYARQGVVTPEMEYIAIRENLGRSLENSNGKIGRASCRERV